MSFGRQVKVEPGIRVVRTTSPLTCGPGCGILAHVRDGILVKVEPGDFPATSHICARGLSYPQWVHHPDRLKYPMKRSGERGENKWQRISWEEALDTIALRLTEIGDRYGPSSLAWMIGGGVLGTLATSAIMGFAGACQGTFILPLGIGDSAGPCGDRVSYGTTLAYGERYTVNFDNPALVLVWGNNPAETDSFKWRRLRDAKDRGARVVAIDPLFTPTASKADEYLWIRPGTDGALALGIMNVILNQGLQDVSFVTDYTVGPFLVRGDNGMFLREKDISPGESEKYVVWDTRTNAPQAYDMPNAAPALTGVHTVKGVDCRPAFHLLAELVGQYPPDKASEITGIPVDTMTRLAIEYATSKPAASFRGMGCQRTFHGDLNFRAISTLAALTGNISFEGYSGFEPNFGAFMTRGIPNLLPILNMYEAILTDKPYPIKALWLARNNLVNQDPNFNRVTGELIPKLELIVVADMFMSITAQYADIVLPACSFFECSDVVTGAGAGTHDYMQLQQKVIEPLHESRSDLDMLAALANRLGMEEFMDKSAEESIELVLASDHPTMEGITLDKLKEGPVLPACGMPDFTTPSGRIEFYSEALKGYGQELPVYLEPLESRHTPLAQRYPLSFSSTHTKYRVHSQFANVPWARELDPEPALDMHPVDAQPRGIEDGDLVRVFNNRGEVKLKARLHQGVMPGLVNIFQGWSPWDYVEGTHQALTHEIINPAQQAVYEPNSAFYDILVEVERVEEG
ncbi:MAG: molybdopterin-dependent oxidoreductase [Chloroflexi bacterium]|nr:molybdopterin-dependent oxidoreductase [Chloroflexota bacterium]